MSILHCDLVPYGIYSYLSGYVVLFNNHHSLASGENEHTRVCPYWIKISVVMSTYFTYLLTFPRLTSLTVVSNLSHVYLSHSLTPVEILNLNAQI